MVTIKGPPEDFTEVESWEHQMTNFDHSISPGLDEELKGGKIFCRHPALDFNGLVWWEDDLFHEQVWVYGMPVAHHEAPTLRELMTAVNDDHGWE